jgi:hypothetical protein
MLILIHTHGQLTVGFGYQIHTAAFERGSKFNQQRCGDIPFTFLSDILLKSRTNFTSRDRRYQELHLNTGKDREQTVS